MAAELERDGQPAPFGLRHARDVRSVATVLAAVGLLLAPHFVPIGVAVAVPWIALTMVLCCACHVVVHNHTHRVLFRTHPLNFAFDLIATIARGHCVSDVLQPHNFNHHREQGGPLDWITPALGGEGHPLARLARFTPRAAYNMVSRRRALGEAGRRSLPQPFRSSIRWEKRLLPVVIAASALHDWQVFLAFQAVPWAGSLVWLVAINLFQHDGCEPQSEYAHSRNFVGWFANWLFFNNGYHTVHHLHPGMHWSEAPRAHAAIAERIPARLNEPSITGFFVRVYLAPRRAREIRQ